MKKISAIAAAFAVSLAAIPFGVFAESTDSCDVYVTITNGEHKIVMEKVTVTDTDADGKLTISDALYNAHEDHYDGGAAEGYAVKKTEYGLSLDKLWGVQNGGSYGYYLNNKMAMSLEDALADGDYISAYVYTDTRTYSDTYTYFDVNTLDVKAGSSFDVTLSKIAFDAQYQPVAQPVEGAVITIDGEATDIVTDANGKATIPTSAAGSLLISAKASDFTMVPPALIVSVLADSTDDPSGTDISSESSNETDIIPVDESSSKADPQADSSSKNDPAASSGTSSDKSSGGSGSASTTTTGGTAAAAASGADAQAAATGSSSLALMIAGAASLAAAAVAANKKKNG